MAQPGLRLRHIVFQGPNRDPAGVQFGPGLNVIYGASETGKSFVVEAIDFMLGGRSPLRDLPERVGYDRVLLGLETLAGEQFTLLRSVDGGAFRTFSGLHIEPPDAVEAIELADQHNEKSTSNLSMFLLQRCALDGKRVRRNKQGDTNSLSFRNLARLVIVTETEIMAQRSPLSDGNPIADTPNFATFKLLLTGVDDSALISNRPKGQEEQSREAQIELLDQILDEYRERLVQFTKAPEDLEGQLQRFEETLSRSAKQLATSEAEYRDLADRQRALRNRLELGGDRRSEIEGLFERFRLLDLHYVSDLARLRGIEEGGTLFQVLGQAPCPLCGADPAHHNPDADCDGNIDAVITSARSEIAKIELLRQELADTLKSLEREASAFDRRLPRVELELRNVSDSIQQLIAPKLTKLRASYADVADKRGEVREALAIYRSLRDAETRRLNIENSPDEQKDAAVSEGDLSAAVAEEFARQVEAILKDWHFPDAERVFFDAKSRDLVIAGKPRAARGKGLRAITHAAFTIGLLQFCKTNDIPHPSFLILDTPLRAYREPEGQDDDLTGTDLNVRFYEYLAGFGDDRQVIIVENTDPPSAFLKGPQVVMFSKNPHSERYGFFPMKAESKDARTA